MVFKDPFLGPSSLGRGGISGRGGGTSRFPRTSQRGGLKVGGTSFLKSEAWTNWFGRHEPSFIHGAVWYWLLFLPQLWKVLKGQRCFLLICWDASKGRITISDDPIKQPHWKICASYPLCLRHLRRRKQMMRTRRTTVDLKVADGWLCFNYNYYPSKGRLHPLKTN